MPREHRYQVIEYFTAWSEWTVLARSKAEAIEKVKRGETEDKGWADNSGPSGRYEVTRLDDEEGDGHADD